MLCSSEIIEIRTRKVRIGSPSALHLLVNVIVFDLSLTFADHRRLRAHVQDLPADLNLHLCIRLPSGEDLDTLLLFRLFISSFHLTVSLTPLSPSLFHLMVTLSLLSHSSLHPHICFRSLAHLLDTFIMDGTGQNQPAQGQEGVHFYSPAQYQFPGTPVPGGATLYAPVQYPMNPLTPAHFPLEPAVGFHPAFMNNMMPGRGLPPPGPSTATPVRQAIPTFHHGPMAIAQPEVPFDPSTPPPFADRAQMQTPRRNGVLKVANVSLHSGSKEVLVFYLGRSHSSVTLSSVEVLRLDPLASRWCAVSALDNRDLRQDSNSLATFSALCPFCAVLKHCANNDTLHRFPTLSVSLRCTSSLADTYLQLISSARISLDILPILSWRDRLERPWTATWN